MSKIFEQGYFSVYAKRSLTHAMNPIFESSQYSAKATVFISHRHDDLGDLQGVLGFFETEYQVKVYIDSKDSSMPITTSAETAITLKDMIRKCDRFILLATNGAIESKWCNWELGFGDANKYPDKIAILPLKPKGAKDYQYKGHEYMRIYPYIAFSDGSQKYTNGEQIAKGYYVVKPKGQTNCYCPLRLWLLK